MPFSLALSGGGCRGAAHIGILLALHEAKLCPSHIAGTSAGAIAAGLYACGRTPEQLFSLCRELQKNGERLIDINLLGIAAAGLQLALRKNITLSGMIKGERLRRLLKRQTGGCALSSVSLPLCIAAVDLLSGETVAYSQKRPLNTLSNTRWEHEGALCDAIYSSCCVPVIFSPLKGQSIMVDGGVADNLPVDLLHAVGAQNIIAVDISQSYVPAANSSLFETASCSLAVMSKRLSDCYVRGERLLIKPKLPENAGLFSFGLMEECVQAGYAAAKELIPLISALAE